MRRVIAFVFLLTLVPNLGVAQRRIEAGFLGRQIELNGQTYRYQVYVPIEYTARSSGCWRSGGSRTKERV